MHVLAGFHSKTFKKYLTSDKGYDTMGTDKESKSNPNHVPRISSPKKLEKTFKKYLTSHKGYDTMGTDKESKSNPNQVPRMAIPGWDVGATGTYKESESGLNQLP